MKILSSVFLLVCLSASVLANPVIKPKFKEVTLKEFTTLEVAIMPYTATQLVFPFLLDNPLLTPELKVSLSNSDGFKVPTSESGLKAEIEGQNTLTIYGKVPEGGTTPNLMGNLFISIGAYNLSIVLKTSYDVRDHISNIVFKLDDKDKAHLLEMMVKSKTEQLETDYKRKVSEYENGRGDLDVVAMMSQVDVDKSTIKKRLKTSIGGKKIVVDVYDFSIFGGRYGSLKFKVKNVNTISNISVYRGDDQSGEALVDGEFLCTETICTFATQDLGLLDYKTLRISVTTESGEGSVKW